MRASIIALLCFAAAACGSKPATEERQIVVPQAVAFDGAQVAQASARIAHGERLSHVLGCTGCHGKALEGKPWIDSPDEGLLHASNLTRAIPSYTDAELEDLLRAGNHPRRPQLWDMPSELFQHLPESDMSALVAYLRSVKPTGGPSPEPVLGRAAKEWIAKGEMKPATQRVAETRAIGPVDLGPGHALGRYITRVTCAECHGPKLEGKPGGNPDLIVAGAYSREEFEKLITQGTATGGRKLHPLMVGVVKGRFSKLTPNERNSLYAYLKARAERRQ